jgi:hypothetical protein
MRGDAFAGWQNRGRIEDAFLFPNVWHSSSFRFHKQLGAIAPAGDKAIADGFGDAANILGTDP